MRRGKCLYLSTDDLELSVIRSLARPEEGASLARQNVGWPWQRQLLLFFPATPAGISSHKAWHQTQPTHGAPAPPPPSLPTIFFPFWAVHAH